MGNVSRSMYRDVRAARKNRTEASKSVKIVRLTAAGKPSRMTEDTKSFYDRADADAYIARLHKLNPGRTFKFLITE